MLFHEIYGRYYQCVARILAAASGQAVTGRQIRRITEQTAFSESTLWIPEALQSGQWPFLKDGAASVLHAPPEMPITTLEKRWLKALLLDPRIRLFNPPMDGLEDVPPLYTPDTLVWFDRYGDGDPYTDPLYIQTFRTLLTAIAEKRSAAARYVTARGEQVTYLCIPYRLEYSQKDDKFRLLAMRDLRNLTLNLSRIRSCALEGPRPDNFAIREPEKSSLVLELTDERNALERAMLHFSHLEKETVRLEENRYQITLRYQKADETELLIRILSFGPMLKVIRPEDFIEKIKTRLQNQKSLRTL